MEITIKDIRKQQRVENFNKSIWGYLILLIVGLTICIADRLGYNTNLLQTFKYELVYSIVTICGFLGSVGYFVLRKTENDVLKRIFVILNVSLIFSFYMYIMVASKNLETPCVSLGVVMIGIIVLYRIPMIPFFILFSFFSAVFIPTMLLIFNHRLSSAIFLYFILIYWVEWKLDTYSVEVIKNALDLQYKLKNQNTIIKEQLEHTKQIQEKIIYGVADLIENRDSETGTHIKRTQSLVEDLLSELRKEDEYKDYLTDERIDLISKAAPLHDIGKIAISDVILNAPRKLTIEEFEVIKKHTSLGGKIISEILEGIEDTKYIETAVEIAKYHHERIDGKGYPEGLTGDEIPLSAKIMAIADVFDALISKRCYKNEYGVIEAVNIMKENKGTQFDEKIFDIFIERVVPKYL